MALYPTPISATPADELRGLSLCAGYGGLDLGLAIAESAYHTHCYVEREAHAAATLVARMEDQALASAPVWDDLKSFDGRPWRGRIDILSAGYPCQPFSFAGQRRGAADPRHLWPDVARIIDEVRPEWVFAENVEGHIDLGFAEVAASLRALGYTAKAGLFSAREAGASHRRRRLFILAHADRARQRPFCRSDGGQSGNAADQNDQPERGQCGPNTAFQRIAVLDGAMDDPARDGVARGRYAAPLFAPGPGDLVAWERLIDQRPDLQPALLRAADGMADRLDRSRGIGNGVFSMAAALAWRTLKADFARQWERQWAGGDQ